MFNPNALFSRQPLDRLNGALHEVFGRLDPDKRIDGRIRVGLKDGGGVDVQVMPLDPTVAVREKAKRVTLLDRGAEALDDVRAPACAVADDRSHRAEPAGGRSGRRPLQPELAARCWIDEGEPTGCVGNRSDGGFVEDDPETVALQMSLQGPPDLATRARGLEIDDGIGLIKALAVAWWRLAERIEGQAERDKSDNRHETFVKHHVQSGS